MGPPELPGGNCGNPQVPDAPALLASMGPPELPGGNTERAMLDAMESARLQWGRRNYPAETLSGAVDRYRAAHGFNGAAGITRRKHDLMQQAPPLPEEASMGPPELPGGNTIAAIIRPIGVAMLQWGRRNYPAETPGRGGDRRHQARMLQWGRRNYPAET